MSEWIHRLGPRGREVWSRWNGTMGNLVTDEERAWAEKWFMALYTGSGRLQKARPLTAEEDAAVQAGIADEIAAISRREEAT